MNEQATTAVAAWLTKQRGRLSVDLYLWLKSDLIANGWADEIEWAATIKPPANATAFALEYAFVICNSGMKAQVARVIFEKVRAELQSGGFTHRVFGHSGKAQAIDGMWVERERVFALYQVIADVDARIEFLEALPWIGGITKWHLAKNLGIDCCKPDRHLVRIAGKGGETPLEMCQRISTATGDKIAVVDSVIWRAANVGVV